MLTIDRTHQHAGCRRVPRRPGTIDVYRLVVTATGHRVEMLREGGRLEDRGALAGTLYEWVGHDGDDDCNIYTGCWFVPARAQ